MTKYPQVAIDNGDGTTRVNGKCTFTSKEYSCTVPSDSLKRFLDGEPAQRSLSKVPLADREFLISGISPAGWREAFG